MAINALTGFKPEVWTAALMAPFEKSLVLGQRASVNRDYIGSIEKLGDTVHISQIGNVTVRPYTARQDITIDDLTVTDNTLKIDQGAYFAFYAEDVEQIQAAGPLKDPAIREGSQQLTEGVETYLAKLYADEAGKKFGTVKIVNDAPTTAGTGQISAYKGLVMLDKALNAASAPHDGRYVVVGPEFYAALLMDPRFTQVDASGSTDGLRNGIVGRAIGFDVLLSPFIPTSGTKETIIAGCDRAAAFVPQINKVETLRADKRFADQVRGLMIYGGKVTAPAGFATLEADISDPAAGKAN